MRALFALLPAVAAFSGGTGGSSNGMSCDAINVCAGGTCPLGMELVAPPERDDHYSLRTKGDAAYTDGGDPTTYTPGETVSIWITVEKMLIQRRVNKGTRVCFCDPPERGWINYNCEPRKGTPCTTPRLEDASYKGLLLYAVDAQENRVGSWEIPMTRPKVFWIPPDTACDNKAVMHADAQDKNYQHRFVWRAPKAGVGPITFRALVKHGDTQLGSFYWPVAPAMGAAAASESPADKSPGGDLVLTEAGATPNAQTWFLAASATQNCEDVCSAVPVPTGVAPMRCDAAALSAAADSPSSVASGIERFYTVAEPPIGSCLAGTPAMSMTSAKWMFFHRTTANANQCSASELTAASCTATAPTDAASVPLNLRRLCPCKAGARRRRLAFRSPGALPPGRDASLGTVSARRLAGEATNAASSRGASTSGAAVTFAISALAALGGSGRHAASVPLLMLAAAQLLPRAAAHNWIWNPRTRSGNKPSMVPPCPPRTSKIPGVHVNPGQDFEVEWSTGHAGQPQRFTIVKAADEKYLALLNENIHESYMNSAPTTAHQKYGDRWEKRHLSWEISQGGATERHGGPCPNSQHESEGKTRVTPSTDPHYITRAQEFKCAWIGRHSASPDYGSNCYEVDGGVQQFKYPDTFVQHDRRVVGKSAQTTDYTHAD